MSAIETELRASVEDILGHAAIEPTASLVDLGASSLGLMRLMARIHGRYGVLVELDELFSGLGLAGLAELIEQRQAPSAAAAEEAVGHPAPDGLPETGTTPLSAFEIPFWEVREFLPAKRAYNEPLAYLVEAELDLPRCRAVLDQLVEAHPVLRSAFLEGPDGTPVRRELSKSQMHPLPLEERDFSGEDDPLAACQARVAELARTDFPLEKPPLFHAFAWRVGPGRWVVGCLLYHIIADLWSAQLLAQEAARRYAAAETGASPEPAAARGSGAQDPLPRWTTADAAFWSGQFADRLEGLAFPAGPRPAIKSFRGNLAQRPLRHSYVRDIEPARRALRVTAASLTFAAFGLLLSAVADSGELVVGVPHLLRDAPGAQHVVGMFLNTLPVRLNVPGSVSTREFVRETHARLQAAIAHASYPVHLMQAQAGAAPKLGRAPHYDHLFTYYEGLGHPATGARGTTEIDLTTRTSKLDLSCFVRRRGDAFDCRMEYSTDLFSPEAVEALLGSYEAALDLILTAPRMSLAEAKASLTGLQVPHALARS